MVSNPLELNKIYKGDSLEILKSFPNQSVDMVMTSPPYWDLRDYGIEGQLGLEPTFQEYINKLCNIFDEIKRVLKPGGSCWVNLGDTYSGNKIGNTLANGKGALRQKEGISKQTIKKKVPAGVKSKSLIIIPERFSIEMINRGWILRNTIIWHKPNCMPSSIKDRFTVDFEKLFFFVKNKKYYFKQQFEPHKSISIERSQRGISANHKLKDTHGGLHRPRPNIKKHSLRAVHGGNTIPDRYNLKGRNKRSVWNISVGSFKEAHFAVYPEKLCEIPIKASCPVNSVVLDPFFGSGTTGLVALKLNRKFIGIEINEEYIKIAKKRLDPWVKQRRLI